MKLLGGLDKKIVAETAVRIEKIGNTRGKNNQQAWSRVKWRREIPLCHICS